MAEPVVTPIRNGWAARGEGWAVHAPTPEEAKQKFRETEARYREIAARPLYVERDLTESRSHNERERR